MLSTRMAPRSFTIRIVESSWGYPFFGNDEKERGNNKWYWNYTCLLIRILQIIMIFFVKAILTVQFYQLSLRSVMVKLQKHILWQIKNMAWLIQLRKLVANSKNSPIVLHKSRICYTGCFQLLLESYLKCDHAFTSPLVPLVIRGGALYFSLLYFLLIIHSASLTSKEWLGLLKSFHETNTLENENRRREMGNGI